MEIKNYTEQDKELIRDLLRTVMTSVMWGDGVKRDIADKHATDMALPLIAKGILEGYLLDNTEGKEYEKYLNNLLDIKKGPQKKAQDEAQDEAQEEKPKKKPGKPGKPDKTGKKKKDDAE